MPAPATTVLAGELAEQRLDRSAASPPGSGMNERHVALVEHVGVEGDVDRVRAGHCACDVRLGVDAAARR